MLTISVYESTYAGLKGYTVLSKIISKGLILYTLFTAMLLICIIVVTIPLASPIKLRLSCYIPLYMNPPEVSFETPGILPGSTVSTEAIHVGNCVEAYAHIGMVILITSLIISSLIITYLSRSLHNTIKKYIAYIVSSVIVGYASVFIIPLISYGARAFTELFTLVHVIVSVGILSVITLSFIIMFTILLGILKRIIKM